MLLWPSEPQALPQLQESPIGTRIGKREITPKICKSYRISVEYHKLIAVSASCSTPTQQNIYAEDFNVIISHLPFLKNHLESNDPSKLIQKIVNQVGT